MNTPQIQIDSQRLNVNFNRFGREAYGLFLKVKQLPEYTITFDQDAFSWNVSAPARYASVLGMEDPRPDKEPLEFSDYLFDDQQAITKLALDAKRFACWSDCGFGKTNIGLEFGRHVHHRTDGRVLFVTLKEIIPQWIEESGRFYGDAMPIRVLSNRQELRRWCQSGPESFAIANYEKFNRKATDAELNELRHLAGLVLDESSRLAGSGKQKMELLNCSRGIEYKLSLTATPAPNEWVEFNDQARFLEKMKKAELVNTFFRRDEKTHRWTLKKHAADAFFKFMASWSIYMRDPKKYGWRMDHKPLPEPIIHRHEIAMTPSQRKFVMDYMAKAPPPAGDKSGTAQMFASDLNVIASQKLSQAAKGFVYGKGKDVRRIESDKPAFIAELSRKERDAGLQVLIWTVYDEESVILKELLGDDAAMLTGRTKEAERIEMLNRFRHGEIPILASRASMLGFGMNFQCCGSMIFSGWTFSYQAWYQAVRRAYRFGQTKRLRIHIPMIPELEGQMYEAIGRKDVQSDIAADHMETCFADVIRGRAAASCSA